MKVQRSGKVTRDRVAQGSKSERDAVMLDTGDGRYILRRAGGNAFRDTTLEQLVGKALIVEGHVHGADFIMSDWHEVPEGTS